MRKILRQDWKQIKDNPRILRTLLRSRGFPVKNWTDQQVIDNAHDSLCKGDFYVDFHTDVCRVCYPMTMQQQHTLSRNFWRAFRKTLIRCGYSRQAAEHTDHIETLRIAGGLYEV